MNKLKQAKIIAQDGLENELSPHEYLPFDRTLESWKYITYVILYLLNVIFVKNALVDIFRIIIYMYYKKNDQFPIAQLLYLYPL